MNYYWLISLLPLETDEQDPFHKGKAEQESEFVIQSLVPTIYLDLARASIFVEDKN